MREMWVIWKGILEKEGEVYVFFDYFCHVFRSKGLFKNLFYGSWYR